MHPLLINAENDHRRRTPEPSTNERKLIAILAIHRMSQTRRTRLRARLATVDEMIGLMRRIIH
jgi:hypothetical protein